MNCTKSIITWLLAIPFIACKQSKQDDGKTYNNTFEVGDIPGLASFQKMDKKELRLDSFLSDGVKEIGLGATNDFRQNRSRVSMQSDPNHKLYSNEKDEGFSAPCTCVIRGDSLFINTNIGFFGGNGFNLLLYRDSFQSEFYLYTDDVKPYKSSLSDTAFSEQAVAKSKFQFLIVDKKPTYKAGQQLTGYFTYTSNRFYELNSYAPNATSVDSSYVTGNIYFTCLTRQNRR
jgi:hypothetical protein